MCYCCVVAAPPCSQLVVFVKVGVVVAVPGNQPYSRCVVVIVIVAARCNQSGVCVTVSVVACPCNQLVCVIVAPPCNSFSFNNNNNKING